MENKWLKRRKRIFDIIEVGSGFDFPSRFYDMINALAIVVNLIVSILYTYSNIREQCGALLLFLEEITIIFFLVDYCLRIWTAKFLSPNHSELNAIKKYAFSFTGIVDLLSFLPYYLPFFFPAGTVAFRMIRIVRIFRLFRINAYYDSLNVITEVINGKRQQLISSVFIISVLMLASSLCMYSLEHEAQPEVFSNAFSGIWWATSTLLTVGYGDIYPITTLGKIFGIFISFLGVGMVAIPTGIISAGFVDQYTNIKKHTKFGYEADMHFIKIRIKENDDWNHKKVSELNLPTGVIVALIKRKEAMIVPNSEVKLLAGDQVILGAEPFAEKEHIHLKEIELKAQNPWIDLRVCDLDISRRSIIVLIKRGDKALVPDGNMVLKAGDRVFLYTQMHILDASDIEI